MGQRLNLIESAPPWRWTLSVRLGQKLSPTSRLVPQWQIEQIVSVDPIALSHNPTAWAQQMQGLLQERIRQWVAQLDKQTECEPVQFHVRRQGASSLELQAGFDSGLRPGDRVLLMDPAHVPARMLEPGMPMCLPACWSPAWLSTWLWPRWSRWARTAPSCNNWRDRPWPRRAPGWPCPCEPV